MTETVRNEITGGVFFGVVVQGQHLQLTLPDRPNPALAGLPVRTSTFAGRQDELQQVLAALAPAEPHTAPGTVVVTGLAGTGKTELMLQAAHEAVRNPGWFPGGVLFLALHGYTAERGVTPKRALGTALRALGVPPEHIPAGLEERALVYRSALSALAAAGRRVLVVLDDVRPSDKIGSLLPGDADTAVLVSSRHSLAEWDAVLVRLRELPPDHGRELLVRVLAAALPEDTRAAVEPDEAERLVLLCDGLPLALRIVASLLVDLPSQPLSELRRRLSSAHSRLSVLSREDRTVTAAFELSYRELTEDQQQVFRLASLHPGPDFSTEAMAVLSRRSADEANRLLVALARRHLIEPAATSGRWDQHSLVWLYAREKLAAAPAEAAGFHDLLLHFHTMSSSACATLFDTADTQPESPFADRPAALRWLNAERSTLVSSVALTHRAGDHLICIALAHPVAQFLSNARYLEEARLVARTAIRSCRATKDRRREANFLSFLGVVLRDMRKLDKSVRAHRKAIDLARKLKGRRRLAGALNNLGLSLHDQRKFDQAVETHLEAAQIFKELGSRQERAQALANAGETLIELNLLDDAEHRLRQAVKSFRKVEDRRGYSQALGALAKVKRISGNPTEAVELHERALRKTDGISYPYDQAVELTNYASALLKNGDIKTALSHQKKAFDFFRQIGDRAGMAMTLGNMALSHQLEKDWKNAIRLHTLALEAFNEASDKHGMAIEMMALSNSLIQSGNNVEALENLQLSAELFKGCGDLRRASAAAEHAERIRRRVSVRSRPGSGA